MIKTKIFLIAVIVGAFSAAASIYVIRDRQSEETAVSSTFDAATSQPPTSEGEVQPREPEGISEAVEGGAPLSELPPLVVNRPSPARKDSSSASVKAVAKKTVTKTVAVESKGSPSQPPALQPIEPAQTQSGSEGSVSEPLSLVLPPKELPPVKLCGGQSVSQCADVEFSHFDFALLILDIISIKGIKEDEEIFDVLESVSIQPVMGWARSDPQKRITTREMEEVRCSISLASDEALIPVGPSIATGEINRFCEELAISLRAIEDSGIIKEAGPVSAESGYQGSSETGYQGGTEEEGVVSSPF